MTPTPSTMPSSTVIGPLKQPSENSSSGNGENTILILILLVINIAQFACFAYALHIIKLAVAELAAFVTQKNDDGLSMRFRALHRDESRLDGTQITCMAKSTTLDNTMAPTQRHFNEYEGISDEVYVIDEHGSQYSPFDGYRTTSVPGDYKSAKEFISSECIEIDKSI
jgi:hypothetical protein